MPWNAHDVERSSLFSHGTFSGKPNYRLVGQKSAGYSRRASEDITCMVFDGFWWPKRCENDVCQKMSIKNGDINCYKLAIWLSRYSTHESDLCSQLYLRPTLLRTALAPVAWRHFSTSWNLAVKSKASVEKLMVEIDQTAFLSSEFTWCKCECLYANVSYCCINTKRSQTSWLEVLQVPGISHNVWDQASGKGTSECRRWQSRGFPLVSAPQQSHPQENSRTGYWTCEGKCSSIYIAEVQYIKVWSYSGII